MTRHEALAIPAPSFGPAVITLFGLNIPVAAMALSMVTLVLVRFVFKPGAGKRKLTRLEDTSLTVILCVILFAAVTGQFGDGTPFGVGMAVAWAIGLGTSGMLVLEVIGDGWLAGLRRLFGRQPILPGAPEPASPPAPPPVSPPSE